VPVASPETRRAEITAERVTGVLAGQLIKLGGGQDHVTACDVRRFGPGLMGRDERERAGASLTNTASSRWWGHAGASSRVCAQGVL
jgi:hypothetical protein